MVLSAAFRSKALILEKAFLRGFSMRVVEP